MLSDFSIETFFSVPDILTLEVFRVAQHINASAVRNVHVIQVRSSALEEKNRSVSTLSRIVVVRFRQS